MTQTRPIFNLTLALILAASLPLALPGQEVPTPAYHYEVVSIHRAVPGQPNSGFSPGAQGGLRALNDSVMMMLTFAYDVRDYQVVGLPDWAQSDRFEVVLTPDQAEITLGPDSSRTETEGWVNRSRQRLQAVLHDRFGLVLRKETRELPVYALSVTRKGPKLTPSADPQQHSTFNINNRQQITAKASTMKMLSNALAALLGRFVLDETGLDASYDFKLEFAPDVSAQLPNSRPEDSASANDTGRPSLFTALTEELGLRLEGKKGPVPVYVVEKVEKPAEN